MIYRHGVDLVYRYTGGRPQAPELPPDTSWAYITEELIERYFGDQPRRRRWYRGYLRQGCIGIVLYNPSGWMGVGWFTTPQVKGPYHLPEGMQKLPVYWFFEDLVRPAYRGRRLHGLLVSLRFWLAYERHEKATPPEIFSDVEVSNVRSRRTYLSSGFVPAGVVDSRSFTIPRFRSFVVGQWKAEVAHPAFEI